MKITIIGGGIGGLTLAIALQKKSHDVQVFEQSESFKKIGAGIILGNNAMQVFGKLGISDKLISLGKKVSKMNLTDQNNRIISAMHLSYFEKKYNSTNLAIHRSDLQHTLAKQLKSNSIHYSKKLTSISQDGNEVMMQFEDGSSLKSDLVIAADGIHSTVRKFIFPKVKYRNTKQICWRGVLSTKLSSSFNEVFTEMWGKGSRLGFGQINENEVYWFALLNAEKPQTNFEDGSWRKEFDSYLPEAKQLLNDTKTEHIHSAFLEDFAPIDSWFNDRICLLGDAAHAMTPNMGQGAGQSIEDAYVLANVLDSNENIFGLDPISNIFYKYEQYRIKKVKTVVSNSWRIGKIAQLNNPFYRKMRNSLMRVLPESANRKQLDFIFSI